MLLFVYYNFPIFQAIRHNAHVILFHIHRYLVSHGFRIHAHNCKWALMKSNLFGHRITSGGFFLLLAYKSIAYIAQFFPISKQMHILLLCNWDIFAVAYSKLSWTFAPLIRQQCALFFRFTIKHNNSMLISDKFALMNQHKMIHNYFVHDCCAFKTNK